MTNPSKPEKTNLIGAMMTSVLTLVIGILGFGASTACFAQAAVTLHQNVTVYRAFYYDDMDKLLHIEIVRNVDGRSLQPLLSAPPVAPNAPPTEPSTAVLIGDKVRYAVYYGVDASQPRPMPNQTDVRSKPLAIERLSEANASRPIECASKGGDSCLFPKMCHACPGACCCF